VAEVASGTSAADDPSRPNIARVYDYLLGGNDHFAADRALADELLARQPQLRANARANRAFMQRVVRYAVADGVTQFLDVGSGLPTGENVHEVARSADPAARVVYVDNDPVVAAHARAILASLPGTTFLLADLREPAGIMAQAGARLDFTAPVAVLCISLLHFIPDDTQAAALVAALTEPLAAGSLLAFTHWKYVPSDEESAQSYSGSVAAIARRGEAELTALVPAGWDLLAPGLVPVTQWRPPAGDPAAAEEIRFYGAVARKR
jgi:O-methyltransferase involved in polyketide biosynthesis